MSRRHKPAKRIPNIDPKYGSLEVSKFINRLMERGKKSIAERIMYDALEILKKRVKEEEPLKVFEKAVINATPRVEVKARRVGGSTFQVPMEVKPDRGFTLACKSIIRFSKSRSGLGMAQKLADEILAAYKNEGSSIRFKDEKHKMAEASRAFAHYRF